MVSATTHRSLSSFLIASAAGSVIALGAITTHAAPSARSQLYSVTAVNEFCAGAQQIKSATLLVPQVVVHTSIDTFQGSSPTPYDGYNVSAYNAKTVAPEGDPDPRGYGTDLPFVNQAFISHGELQPSGLEIAIVVSCKMKNPSALKAYYGDSAAGANQSCSSVNQDTVNRVFASLTAAERRYLRYSQSQIVFDPDMVVASGPDWLTPLPEGLPPTVAYVGDDGLLHIKAKYLNVPKGSLSPLVGPDKKGTTYCHFITPEYVRGLVTGQVQPFLTPYSPTN